MLAKTVYHWQASDIRKITDKLAMLPNTTYLLPADDAGSNPDRSSMPVEPIPLILHNRRPMSGRDPRSELLMLAVREMTY